jgi:hypothetical protein
MNCERCMERYLETDNRRPLPLIARWHLAKCPACRAEIARAQLARDRVRAALPEAGLDRTDAIMASVRLAPRPRREVGIREWLISLLAILVSMAIAPLGANFAWVKELFGSGYLLPFYLVFGIALTVYCVLFIGSHLDSFSERFGIEKTASPQ